MSAAELEDCLLESEPTEMAMTAAVLEERVNNHIRAFIWIILVIIGWLTTISVELYHLNGTMNRVEKAQVNAPAQIVARILSRPSASKEETMDALLATATVLKSSKIGPVKPDAAVLKQAASEIMKSQDSYPEMPAVWQATSAFINYRFNALLPASSHAPLARGAHCEGILGMGGWIFENCELSLETLSNNIRGTTVNGASPDFIFVNCIVHYEGGLIPAKNLYFNSSIMEFRVHAKPVSDGVLAMRQLMTADPNSHITL